MAVSLKNFIDDDAYYETDLKWSRGVTNNKAMQSKSLCKRTNDKLNNLDE